MSMYVIGCLRARRCQKRRRPRRALLLRSSCRTSLRLDPAEAGALLAEGVVRAAVVLAALLVVVVDLHVLGSERGGLAGDGAGVLAGGVLALGGGFGEGGGLAAGTGGAGELAVVALAEVAVVLAEASAVPAVLDGVATVGALLHRVSGRLRSGVASGGGSDLDGGRVGEGRSGLGSNLDGRGGGGPDDLLDGLLGGGLLGDGLLGGGGLVGGDTGLVGGDGSGLGGGLLDDGLGGDGLLGSGLLGGVLPLGGVEGLEGEGGVALVRVVDLEELLVGLGLLGDGLDGLLEELVASVLGGTAEPEVGLELDELAGVLVGGSLDQGGATDLEALGAGGLEGDLLELPNPLSDLEGLLVEAVVLEVGAHLVEAGLTEAAVELNKEATVGALASMLAGADADGVGHGGGGLALLGDGGLDAHSAGHGLASELDDLARGSLDVDEASGLEDSAAGSLENDAGEKADVGLGPDGDGVGALLESGLAHVVHLGDAVAANEADGDLAGGGLLGGEPDGVALAVLEHGGGGLLPVAGLGVAALDLVVVGALLAASGGVGLDVADAGLDAAAAVLGALAPLAPAGELAVNGAGLLVAEARALEGRALLAAVLVVGGDLTVVALDAATAGAGALGPGLLPAGDLAVDGALLGVALLGLLQLLGGAVAAGEEGRGVLEGLADLLATLALLGALGPLGPLGDLA